MNTAGEKIINIVVLELSETPKIYSYIVRGSELLKERVKEVEMEFKLLIKQSFPNIIFTEDELDLYAKERFYFNDDVFTEFRIILSNI